MESREYLGYWWVEERPDRSIPGILEYHPTEGMQLELIDDFLKGIPQSGQPAENIDKILGVNENGDGVTLIDCTRNTGSISSGIRSSEYLPRIMIEGFVFQNMNPALDNLAISFYGIDKWAALTNPRPGDEFLSNPNNPDRISIVFDVPDTLSAWRDDVKLELGVHPKLNTERYESGELQVRHEFKVRPRRTQMPFEYYLTHINNLNNFVTLGLGNPTDPRYVRGSIRTFDGQSHNVKIFYPIQGELNNEVNVHPLRMLFRPLDIAENFEYVVNQWYDRREEIDEIYDLYFAMVFQDKVYPENHFMNLCHGLESYHRKRFQDIYMDPSDFDEVYNDFMELLKGDPSTVYSSLGSSADNLRTKHGISNPFVQSLRDGTIKHANKKSLRRRLNEVITSIKPLLDDLPYSIVGKHRKVANTRNYFAHRTDDLRQKAALGPELVELIWGIQQLIEACLLLEIGIHPDQIEERLSSRYSNRFVS